ncbi:hypothetical protein LCGC14_0232310 [marine sediment metagenome]|uniref:Uncharacterized protein n=1 Tax=marine sediment metagenome TaxID=412755 RepID=A0A0F9UA96_9ZZZZ
MTTSAKREQLESTYFNADSEEKFWTVTIFIRGKDHVLLLTDIGRIKKDGDVFLATLYFNIIPWDGRLYVFDNLGDAYFFILNMNKF